MSIENTNTIDAIGVDRQSGKVILTLIDTMSWEKEEEHLRLLQDKLNTYLRFVESGEVLQSYPAAAGRKYVIGIIAQNEPTELGFQFLSVAREGVEGAGFEFQFELRTG